MRNVSSSPSTATLHKTLDTASAPIVAGEATE
jgi:hypothetical protein